MCVASSSSVRKNPSETGDVERHATLEEGPGLHRRSVRAQHQTGLRWVDVEGVLHLAGRMVGVEVERVEVEPFGLDLRSLGDLQPIPTKTSAIRWLISSGVGWRRPSGRRPVGSVTSIASPRRGSARHARPRARPAAAYAWATSAGLATPFSAFAEGRQPRSRLASASAARSPWWVVRAALTFRGEVAAARGSEGRTTASSMAGVERGHLDAGRSSCWVRTWSFPARSSRVGQMSAAPGTSAVCRVARLSTRGRALPGHGKSPRTARGVHGCWATVTGSALTWCHDRHFGIQLCGPRRRQALLTRPSRCWGTSRS